MIGRVFRIVRTPLTLLILLGVLCYGAWWGWNNVIATVPPLPPEPCVQQTLPNSQLRSTQVTVNVYNGGDRRGLAGDVGRALRDKGFKVQRTSNTGENIKQTVIVGANAKNPEVVLVRPSSRTRPSGSTSAPTARSTCWSATSTAASTRRPPPPSW